MTKPYRKSQRNATIDSSMVKPSKHDMKILDMEFIHSRQHNASALIGPGQYNLPVILGSSRCNSISTIKQTPNVSFGIKPVKKSYYQECYKDFIGIDSPGLNTYKPNIDAIKTSNPKFSVSRQDRFLKPSTFQKQHQLIPHQYTTIEYGGHS